MPLNNKTESERDSVLLLAQNFNLHVIGIMGYSVSFHFLIFLFVLFFI